MSESGQKSTWSWFGNAGSVGNSVMRVATTGAALVSIFTFLYSFGVLGQASARLTVGSVGAAWVGLQPAADTAASIGDTLHLALTVTDKNGTVLVGTKPVWTNDDASVATVGPDGSVVTRGPGVTTVVVTVGELTARARIVVQQRVAALTFEGDSIVYVAEGDRHTVRARPLDARGSAVAGRPVVWHATDTAIAVVDSTGTITGAYPGRTLVAATVDGITAHLPVTIVPVPAAMTLLSETPRHLPAGAPLAHPITVRVTSRRNRPVEGALVRFRTADGLGVVEPAAVLTDHDGRAKVAWTLSVLPGRQSLLASVERVDSVLSMTVEADPVPANTRVATAGDRPSGAVGKPLPEPVAVRVTDTTGRLLADVPISWTALDGGTVTSLAERTDSLGEARAEWILGPKSGTQRVRVQVGRGRGVPPHLVEATALPGAPAKLTIVRGDKQRATAGKALAKRIVVRVADAGGNPVPGVPLTLEPGAGSVPDSMPRTDSTGVAGIEWTMHRTAGTYQLTVRAEGVKEPLHVSARATAAAPANLTFHDPPSRGTTGRALSGKLVAVVTDVYGNPVPDAIVSFAPKSGRVSPKRIATDAEGRARVTWTLGAKAGEQTLTGRVNGSDVSGDVVVKAVAPKPPAKSSASKNATGRKTSARPGSR